jgi:hypothetical protein
MDETEGSQVPDQFGLHNKTLSPKEKQRAGDWFKLQRACLSLTRLSLNPNTTKIKIGLNVVTQACIPATGEGLEDQDLRPGQKVRKKTSLPISIHRLLVVCVVSITCHPSHMGGVNRRINTSGKNTRP